MYYLKKQVNAEKNGARHYLRSLKKLAVGFMFLAGMLMSQTAHATLVCNGTPNSPLNVAVDPACEAVITTDMVLEDPGSAPGPKLLEARDMNNNLIASGMDQVVVPGTYLGQVISITVIDINTNNQCTGYMLIMDNLPPEFLDCNIIDVDASCNANTHPDAIGYPNVIDNCSPVTLTWFDQMVGPDCNIAPPYIGFITRTWTATDASGNSAQCVQTINLLRATLGDVVIPANTTVSCDNPLTDPLFTGMPTINGNPIMTGGYCEISATFSDNIVYTCLPAIHSYQIVRTWTVVENCAPGGVMSFQQVITVADDAAPVVSCPPEIIANTDPAVCSGTVQFPVPTVSDNCSTDDDLTWQITTTFGGFGFGPHVDVPAGMHDVSYVAIDECGNISASCHSVLKVLDLDPPTAICDEFTVVSIPSTGLAVVPAANLDDGSYDNCMNITFTGTLDGGVTYSEYLYFDCDDVGQQIMVTVRVEEVGNPAAYNECDVIVTVDDKLPPVITCPPDQVIDCQDDYWDLSIYGYPTVTDNCGYTLTSDSLIDLTQCGTGIIKRTFTAIDASGNGATCMQTLDVENLTPFDGSTIGWPADYEIDNACIEADQLDPDDLPAPFNYPVLPSENCALLAYNYTDQIFHISYPACYKIIRTWSVMDWCVFDPDTPNSPGIWTHTQIIKANDYIMPELTVPADTTFGVDLNCEYGYVHLPLATATDCATNVSITNDSPYADSNGANASGHYPLGTTTVTYTAVDGCGNAKSASVEITVIDDTYPTVICDSGISTDVAEMGGGQIFVMVPADIFIAHTSDNCTDLEDLQIFIGIADGDISSPPNTTELQFFCEDVGSYMVEIWVVDEAGNADFCITNLNIQDNFELCPDLLMHSIAGLIETESGTAPGDVEVSISSPAASPMDVQTGSTFHFNDLTAGGDYSVVATFDAEAGNGVTTYDMVLITRHILGVSPLDSPYKIIAADVNGSGSVTTLDLVYIQKVILNVLDEFPNVPAWRFVDADWQFTDPQNPFYDNFPEVLNFNNLDGDELDANFMAIKVGDVNLTAANADNPDLQENTSRSPLHFDLLDEYVEPGTNFTIDFLSNSFQSIAAFQFTMQFDPNDVTLEGIEACALPNLGVSNFGTQNLVDGYITGSWYYHQGVQLRNGVCLFSFTISTETGGYLSDLIQFTGAPTDLVAYRENGTPMDIVLQFIEIPGQEVILYQNKPNPFSSTTEISFYLPKNEKGKLTVYDMTGKVVMLEEKTFNAGLNNVVVSSSVLRERGMYYYQLETPSFTGVKKMMYSGGK